MQSVYSEFALAWGCLSYIAVSDCAGHARRAAEMQYSGVAVHVLHVSWCSNAFEGAAMLLRAQLSFGWRPGRASEA